jgi:hypothetical protein
MTDKKKAAKSRPSIKKKGDAPAGDTPGMPATPAAAGDRLAHEGTPGAVAATTHVVPREESGEPPHGDPLRPAVSPDAAFTGADRGATRHGEHPPRVGSIDSAAPAVAVHASLQAAAPAAPGRDAGAHTASGHAATAHAASRWPRARRPTRWCPTCGRRPRRPRRRAGR